MVITFRTALVSAIALLLLWTGIARSQGAEAELVAVIHLPYESSSVRANVPIFGLAYGKIFQSYRLEFGQGRDPKEWTLIKESTEPEEHDPWAEGKVKWSKDWGVETGNLGVWRTGLSEYTYGQHWEHDLLGPYTLRLTVADKHGREAQHSVHVIVARVVRNDIGGSVESPDGVARLEAGADSITSAFVLVSLLPRGDPLLPSTEPKPAKNLLLIGTAYEFQPPGLEFNAPGRTSPAGSVLLRLCDLSFGHGGRHRRRRQHKVLFQDGYGTRDSHLYSRRPPPRVRSNRGQIRA